MACNASVDGYANDLAAELASTLDWWAEAGVNALVQDEARAWLVAEEPQLAASVVRDAEDLRTEAGEAAPRLSPEKAPEDPFPDQLDLFQEWLRTSTTLPYAAHAAPRVCPVGDPAAGLMIFAPMPSSDDCAAGTLLSSAPGRLFDRMLAAIGRNRETIYLAGLSCFRPAGGRFDRSGGERCTAIARHHVALAAPKTVLLLGDACSKALLGIGAASARGKVHQLEADGQSFDAVVTLSPEYLLQQPAAKAMAWADLQLLMENLAAKT